MQSAYSKEGYKGMKRILALCGFIVLLSHSSYAEDSKKDLFANEKQVHMSESRHFGVMWDEELNQTLEKDYPKKISDEFEKAWAFFTNLGFKQPIYTSRISTLDPIELYPKILITLKKNIPEVTSPS